MRRVHLETLAPRCPVCEAPSPLRLERVLREEREHVLEGWLSCANSACQREFPLVDGVPQFTRDLRAHVKAQTLAFLGRDELDELSESWLGDCSGPQSEFDTLRQHLSQYTWDHWAEFDPLESEREPAPGSIVRVLDALWRQVGALPDGPLLEIGCSAGRTSFELARRSERLTLGVDLHQGKLRLAQRVLRDSRVRYARRRVGVNYDRREFAVPTQAADKLDFWSVDAAQAPFADGSFAAVVALNVLDSTHAPLDLLRSCARLLAPGGALVLACPYDWSASAAPLEHWFGGHSQRGPNSGASEPVLRSMLGWSGDAQLARLELQSELDGLEWNVRLHERSVMRYRLHGVVARRR
jgi:SAM-dependent methyltransferase/uncharacterized protein YbaR (Trm112 family)